MAKSVDVRPYAIILGDEPNFDSRHFDDLDLKMVCACKQLLFSPSEAKEGLYILLLRKTKNG